MRVHHPTKSFVVRSSPSRVTSAERSSRLCFLDNRGRRSAATRGRATRVPFGRLSTVVRYVISMASATCAQEMDRQRCEAVRPARFRSPAHKSPPNTPACVRGRGRGPWHAFAFHASVHVAPGTRAGFISTLMSQLEAAGLPLPRPATLLPERARSAH